MKHLFVIILLLISAFVSFSQSACAVKKAYAYYTVSLAGAQMADENGNPIPVMPMINRFIYVEFSGSKMPEIKAVLFNNETLPFTLTAVKQQTVSIGNKKLNPNNTIIAKKGNTLLKINLQANAEKPMPEPGSKNITLKYKSAGKVCKFYIPIEKEIATLPSY